MSARAMPPLVGMLHARLAGLQRALLPEHGAHIPEGAAYLNTRLLKLITLARVIVVLIGLTAIGLAMQRGLTISPLSFAGIVASLVLISWAGILHTGLGSQPTQGHLLIELSFDIVLLTVVLSLVGLNTPFDFIFLLPLVFGAAAFSGWRLVALFMMASLGWITVHYFDDNLSVGYPGEVLEHIVLGGVVAFFAFAVAGAARKHERILSGHRERAITALGQEAKGMVATQAAHALSTPLGTMAVIVADLREGRIPEEERDAALETLVRQIAHCKLQLSGLLQSTGVDRGEGAYRTNVFEILNEIREECLLHYPNGSVEILRPDAGDEPRDTLMEISLFNALAGIVKDLLREPPHVAELSTAWDPLGVVIEVRRGGVKQARAINPRRQERLAVLAAILERHAGTLATGPGERIVARLPYADALSTNSQ